VENLCWRFRSIHCALAPTLPAASRADGLGQADHVGFTPKNSLAPPRQACAGFHFVEDQQRAVFVQMLRRPCKNRAAACTVDIHQDGFEKDRGDLSGGYCLKRFSTLFRLLKLAATTSRATPSVCHATGTELGHRDRRNLPPCLDADERGVMQSVIGTFELRILSAARGGAREYDRHAS